MSYPSDLTDNQWSMIKEYFDQGNYGNRRKHDQRVLLNAVFYVIKTGCQWRFLPKEYPPWKTVYSFYKRAKDKGIWEKVMGGLVEKSRVKLGKNKQPSYSLIDSQSVKTSNKGEKRGIDGGKKIKGRKRHIVTDTAGHILEISVHEANIHDTVSGCEVFSRAVNKYPTIKGVCADGGYRKTMENFVKEKLKRSIDISQRILPGWSVLAKRWVVERTFAWFTHFRRLSKDYEITIKSAENTVMIAHSMLLLKRIDNS